MSLIKPASHLLLYSVAFGGSAFYSYFASPIAFKVLKREQFSILQNHMFPWFFKMHAFGPMVLALTTPVPLGAGAMASLAAASTCGLINLYGFLPWTRTVKEDRMALKQRLDSKQITPEQFEKDDQPLKKQFGKTHGLSLLFNLGHVTSLLVYGCYLTSALLHYIPK